MLGKAGSSFWANGNCREQIAGEMFERWLFCPLAMFLVHFSFWCHFDDDSFVIVENLLSKLRHFHAQLDLYLGRHSTSGPISLPFGTMNDPILGRKFWFGTGGAGYCLSKSTLRKLHSFTENNRFETICAQLGLPDDVTLGFVLSMLRGKLGKGKRLKLIFRQFAWHLAHQVTRFSFTP
jgi:hypothetical protein